MNILVIRFSSIGDILLTTSVPFALREQYPDAKIVFLTKEAFVPLLKGHPAGIEVVGLKRKESISALRSRLGKFHLVIDLHNSLRTRLLRLFMLSTPWRSLSKPYFKRWLLVRFKWNFFRKIERVRDRYLNVVFRDKKGHDFPGWVPQKKPKDEVLQTLPKGKILAIAPGARWYTKQWPEEYYVEFLKKFLSEEKKMSVVLLGGNDERLVTGKIAAALENNRRVVNMAGLLSLPESFWVLNKASLFLSGDSSLTHAASILEIPSVILFLSTVPEFGFEPFGKHYRTVSADVACKPCDHKGLARCPRGHFQCAYLLHPELVENAVNELKGTENS